MPERFVILSLPRCGSTTLANALNCHPDIRCINEPFNFDQWRNKYLGEVRDPGSLRTTLTDIWRRHNGIKHVWEPSGWPFRGDNSINVEMMTQPDVRMVLLTRDNHLQRVISHELAAQTDVWQRRTSSNTATLAPLALDTVRRRVAASRAATEFAIATLRDFYSAFASVTYEQIYLTGNGIACIDSILDFIGAAPLPAPGVERVRKLLDPELHKLNTEGSYLAIPNVAEIEEACGADETGHLFACDLSSSRKHAAAVQP